MQAKKEVSHAEQNAQGWWEEIKNQVDRLLIAEAHEGPTPEDPDSVRNDIVESTLCSEVRGDWRVPGRGGPDNPVEFRILLTTGGPALRIIGELDEHMEPRAPRIEWQDWGTPWTVWHLPSGTTDEWRKNHEALLTFCRCFYFGE